MTAPSRPYGPIASAAHIEHICTRRPEGTHTRPDGTHFQVFWFGDNCGPDDSQANGWYWLNGHAPLEHEESHGPYSRADLACRAGFADDPEADDYEPGEPDGADLTWDEGFSIPTSREEW